MLFLSEPAQKVGDAAKVGRRFAAALYWMVAVYVIAAGFISVVPQIFWPSAASGVAPAEATRDCPGALRALHSDLLSGAGDRTRDPGSDPIAPFLERWDERYRALEAPCGDLPSYALLERLRYGVEEHLLRFEAEQAPLAAETLRAIEADTGSTH